MKASETGKVKTERYYEDNLEKEGKCQVREKQTGSRLWWLVSKMLGRTERKNTKKEPREKEKEKEKEPREKEKEPREKEKEPREKEKEPREKEKEPREK
ncbi:MAG: hypothetical protein LBG06_11250, partial [Deltaproteobacteria bacterium]|nr:hypothetical protein [Deltaproteobacteria bacterium]